jgi:hypothetical protein
MYSIFGEIGVFVNRVPRVWLRPRWRGAYRVAVHPRVAGQFALPWDATATGTYHFDEFFPGASRDAVPRPDGSPCCRDGRAYLSDIVNGCRAIEAAGMAVFACSLELTSVYVHRMHFT